MIAAIVVLSLIAALLLLYAVRLIFCEEYRRRINAAALDEAISARYRTGMTQEQLDELAAERWQD